MEPFGRLIKLKPGSRERVQQWASTLNERKAEALDTLAAEGVVLESWFFLEMDGDEYLMLYMRSRSMAEAERVGTEANSDIDQIHQQFKVDTWVRGEGAVGTLLLDMELNNNGAGA